MRLLLRSDLDPMSRSRLCLPRGACSRDAHVLAFDEERVPPFLLSSFLTIEGKTEDFVRHTPVFDNKKKTRSTFSFLHFYLFINTHRHTVKTKRCKIKLVVIKLEKSKSFESISRHNKNVRCTDTVQVECKTPPPTPPPTTTTTKKTLVVTVELKDHHHSLGSRRSGKKKKTSTDDRFIVFTSSSAVFFVVLEIVVAFVAVSGCWRLHRWEQHKVLFFSSSSSSLFDTLTKREFRGRDTMTTNAASGEPKKLWGGAFSEKIDPLHGKVQRKFIL